MASAERISTSEAGACAPTPEQPNAGQSGRTAEGSEPVTPDILGSPSVEFATALAALGCTVHDTDKTALLAWLDSDECAAWEAEDDAATASYTVVHCEDLREHKAHIWTPPGWFPRQARCPGFVLGASRG